MMMGGTRKGKAKEKENDETYVGVYQFRLR
jgi:hypothetical protein